MLLFIVGTCIRLAGTDPWQAITWRVNEVGSYSYRVVDAQPSPHTHTLTETIPFESMLQYVRVSCR